MRTSKQDGFFLFVCLGFFSVPSDFVIILFLVKHAVLRGSFVKSQLTKKVQGLIKGF